MYKRILLAYDGSVEGRAALREGALLAKRCGAKVYLLSVVTETPGMRMAEGAHSGAVAQHQGSYKAILEQGVERLRAGGFDPVAKLVVGEPSVEIGAFAEQIGADLVVVSHRRQNFLERWWLGATGGYLVDNINCSLLISRNAMSDEAFAEELQKASEPAA